MGIKVKNSQTAMVLALGACVSMAACGGHGPNTYLMPKDAVVAKLKGAEREFSIAGKDTRTIRATSARGDTVKVQVKYNTGPLGTNTCEARVEAIDDEWTRVTPVCPMGDDASDRLIGEVNQMQVDEFVIAVLYDRDVDSAMVLKRTSAVTIDNIGNIAKEASEAAKTATTDPAYSTSGGWGSDDGTGSDWGSGS